MDTVLILSLFTALGGGLVRGTTGFGAAMVMTPILALLIGPRAAVPVALLLETFAAAPMLPAASRLARWRLIAPIGIAAVATVPLGGLILQTVDATSLRRLIAATVIVFCLALLANRRFRGPHRLSTSAALGALSGTMLGATSIGAPPVILYLLSGPDPIAVTRANLTLYIVIVSAAGLVMLSVAGFVDRPALTTAALMAIPFAIGIVAGSRLFSRFSDQRFRQATMIFMLLVSIGILLR